MNIIIINGYPGSGKTTFQLFCSAMIKNAGYSAYSRSTVDEVKHIASYCGWDGSKTPENRKFLSELKQLLISYNDFCLNDIKGFVEAIRTIEKNNKNCTIFIDCREKDEIEKLVNAFPHDQVKRVCIIRTVDQSTLSNHADRDVYEITYDYYINNNESLSHLNEEARLFCKSILN